MAKQVYTEHITVHISQHWTVCHSGYPWKKYFIKTWKNIKSCGKTSQRQDQDLDIKH